MVVGNQGDTALGTWSSIAFAAAKPLDLRESR